MTYPPRDFVRRPPRETGIAYLLWFFLGAFGAHQFYMGKTGRAISYLLTLGWLTIGLWIDLFTIPGQIRKVNAKRLREDQAQGRALQAAYRH
jgi:TM2 domain-containing membrane protein YozV